MEFKFNQTAEDLVNFNIFHIQNSEMTKKSRFKSRVAISLIYIVFLLFINYEGISMLTITLSIVLSMIFLYYIIFWDSIMLKKVGETTEKMILEGKNKGVIGEHHIVFKDKKIIEKDSVSEIEFSYEAVEKLGENDDYFFVYVGSLQALLIKKELFKKKKDMDEFRNYILSRIPD